MPDYKLTNSPAVKIYTQGELVEVVMRDEEETTACKICGTQTAMLGTKLCDPCWELERRIGAHPEIARKILANLDLANLDKEKLNNEDSGV